jgi:hypothetical protein
VNIPNLSAFKSLAVLGKTFVLANRPELLFGASIAATLASVGLAGKGGYDAGRKVMEAEHPSYDLTKPEKPLELKEKASLTWLCYAPAAISTVGALGATTGLHIVHVSEKKALAQMALGAIEEVKDVAREFEEERNGALSANANKKGVAKMENSDGEIEELFLVRDPVTGRDIWSNAHRIEQAMVDTANLVVGDNASLNNFYEYAGFGRTSHGDEVGWSGALPYVSWTDVNGQPITGVRDDGRPFRGFRFLPDPERDFDNGKP